MPLQPEIAPTGGGGGVEGEDHSLLDNLDYASAGHTGFVPSIRQLTVVAPLTGGGDLSADRSLGITQATVGTDGYLTAADWLTFFSRMQNPMSALGDLIYGGALGAPTRLGIGSAGHVLHGGSTPSWSEVVETDFAFTDITTANATAAKHGLLPRLSGNSGQYLDGGGNWSTPAASAVTAYSTTSFTSQTSVTVTHNFGVYPAVQVIDGTGAMLIPQSITHTSVNAFTVTFLVSTSGTIVATVGSPGAQAYRAVNSDYTIVAGDRIIKATAALTVTMISPTGKTGAEFIIDNASTADVTLAPSAAETIEGESSQTLPPNSAIHVYCDGVNWRIY